MIRWIRTSRLSIEPAVRARLSVKACEPSKESRSHMGGQDGNTEMLSQTEAWAFEATRMAFRAVPLSNVVSSTGKWGLGLRIPGKALLMRAQYRVLAHFVWARQLETSGPWSVANLFCGEIGVRFDGVWRQAPNTKRTKRTKHRYQAGAKAGRPLVDMRSTREDGATASH